MVANQFINVQHWKSAITGSISVLSISHPAWQTIQSLPGQIHPLGVFNRSIDFLAGEEVIALVTPELLNGPFHVVIDAMPLDPLPPACSVSWEEEGLVIGTWLLRMPIPLLLWNPRPSWEDINLAEESLQTLYSFAVRDAGSRRTGSLFTDLLLGVEISLLDAFGQAIAAMDPEAIREAAFPLVGLGPGLTPSGDDFLAGVMLALHAQPLTEDFKALLCTSLYQAVEGRTTRLSQAFLKAARDGMADERWHHLLAAINNGNRDAIMTAARAALDYGETSGLDMVSGFLWLCNKINLCG